MKKGGKGGRRQSGNQKKSSVQGKKEAVVWVAPSKDAQKKNVSKKGGKGEI